MSVVSPTSRLIMHISSPDPNPPATARARNRAIRSSSGFGVVSSCGFGVV